MSSYSTQLRFLLEKLAGETTSQPQTEVENIIEAARQRIFNFNYGLTGDTKKELEQKILRHFYTYEIGFETEGLFILKLRTKMLEIMPRYVKMFELAEQLNPYKTIDITKTVSGSSNTQTRRNGTDTTNVSDTAETSAHNSATRSSTNKYSDTPQGSLDGLLTDTYLTNATIDSETTSDTATAEAITERDTTKTTNETENGETITGSTEHTTGFTGDMLKVFSDYVETKTNIELMIINELYELFILIY